MAITINVTPAAGGTIDATAVDQAVTLSVTSGIGPVGANAALIGGSGIDVTYANGEATLELNATLATLADVSAAAPTAGQVLAWNGTTWAAADDSANLTGYATESYVDTAVSTLVDAAPGTLDTLNELAAALGDDPNFSATITASLAGKAAANHTHNIADVTGLQATLDAKAATASLATVATSGNYSDLSGIPAEFSPSSHNHTSSDITDFAAAAAANAPLQTLNGLTGDINITGPGIGIGVETDGQNIVISYTPPTSAPTVQSVNTLSGDLTLAAGDNVTITTSGSTLTFSAAGGGGGVSSLDAGTFPRVGSLLTEVGDNLTSETGDQLTPEQATSGAVLQVLRSNVTAAVPTSLADGELAINTQDGSLFWADAGGTIQSFVLADYAAASHTHTSSDITDFAAAAAANAPIQSVNSLTGTLTLAAGTGVTITESGSTITFSASAASALDDLTDVDAPTPSSGQVLKWNGTSWAPATDQFGNGTGGGGGYSTALLFG